MKVQKILLVGEFSNLHWTLAQGLRKLGQDVVVVSNGDVWKNYERDIDIKFKNFSHKITFLKSFFFSDTYKGFDVVQLIGCPFLLSGSRTSWNKIFFKHLKAHNKKIYLGAFGDDYYYQNVCVNGGLEYSPLDIIKKGDAYAKDVFNCISKMKNINEYLAKEVDGIIAGCYEYYKAYEYGGFSAKLRMIPFPINTDGFNFEANEQLQSSKIRFFIGVQKSRNAWKGTDVLVEKLQELSVSNPDMFEVKIVSDVPYEEYVKMYSKCDIIVDQLYSYSPAMNALTSMLQGKVVISGGEPEIYQILGEKKMFPIINFNPKVDVRQQFLEVLKFKKEEIVKRKEESVEFVKKHHDYVNIAKQYIEFWSL